MRHAIRPALLLVLAAGLPVLRSTPAAAADRPACTTVRSHQACTILRPIAAGARSARFGAPECVVVVGGLGSRPEDLEPFFAPVLAGLGAADGDLPYRIAYFGIEQGDRHPFAPFGAIGLNADNLRGLVRDLADECSATHVVAHSMGGAIADRALSMGLSANDGVVTYLPISSPHNGSLAARALRLGVELDDRYASAVGAIARRTGLHDPTSDAVRDLGRRPRSPRPPRVATVRQRVVTDLIVLRGDTVDRRVDVREYLPGSLPEWEGHGGAVANEHVRRVVQSTLRKHRAPADHRSPVELRSAALASRLVEHYWSGLIAAAGLALADIAAGSAVADGEDGDLPARAAERGAEAAELLDAAAGLGDPLPLTLLRSIVGAALE